MRDRLIRVALSSLLLSFISFPVWCQPLRTVSLREYLETRLAERKLNGPTTFLQVCNVDGDPLAARVFREYGAIFAAANVTLPPRCIFNSDADLAVFQKALKARSAVISGVTIELQEAAMDALLEAVAEIQPRRITPLDGAIAGRRNYADTVRIWNSRFIPALKYWVSKRKIVA